MARTKTGKREVYLDTSYAIALVVIDDEYHERAIALSRVLEQQRRRLVTSRAVVIEIGNSLARRQFRSESVRLLRSLENDTDISLTVFRFC
jgi:hypothetical protein